MYMCCIVLSLGKRKFLLFGDYWVNYVFINVFVGVFVVMKLGGESINKGFYFVVFEFFNK